MTPHATSDGSIVLRFTAAERWAGGFVAAAAIALLIAIGLGARAEAQSQTKEMVKITVELRHINGTITDHETRLRTLEHGGD